MSTETGDNVRPLNPSWPGVGSVAYAVSIVSGVLLAVSLLQATQYQLNDLGAAFVAAVELYTQDLYWALETVAHWLASLFTYQIDIDRDRINFLVLFIPLTLCAVTILLSVSWHFIVAGDFTQILAHSARLVVLSISMLFLLYIYALRAWRGLDIEPLGTPPGRFDHLWEREPDYSQELHFFLMLAVVIGAYRLFKAGVLGDRSSLDIRFFVLAGRTSTKQLATIFAIFVLCVDWTAYLSGVLSLFG